MKKIRDIVSSALRASFEALGQYSLMGLCGPMPWPRQSYRDTSRGRYR
jgi:hypothetical protein